MKLRENRKPGVDYALVNDPHHGEAARDYYVRVRVFNVDTGEEVEECVEVDCVEGWAIVFSRYHDGTPITNAGHITRKTIHGNFELRKVEGDDN